MPSFYIYELQDQINPLLSLKKFDIKAVQLKESETDAVRNKFREYKKTYRTSKLSDSHFVKEKHAKIQIEHQITLEDAQKVWVNEQMSFYFFQNLILIQKKQGGINLIFDKYLKFNHRIKRRYFNKRKLFRIWNKLKTVVSVDNNEIILKRVICRNPILDSSRINEININDNDLENIPIFNEVKQTAEECNALTFRIVWSSGVNISQKYTTVRFDKNGSILIYGTPTQDVVMLLLSYFKESI